MTLTRDINPNPVSVKLTEPGEDLELKAMAYSWSVLCELNQVERDRAIEWLAARNRAAAKDPRTNDVNR